MVVEKSFWSGRRVLLTGHTGFKGSWLSLWLQSLGTKLCGIALPAPTTNNLFSEARVEQGMISLIQDIRDEYGVKKVVADFLPEIVIHMAAQPLVRLSYQEPVATYSTNVMGTVHVLEACRNVTSVRAIVNVTTDKCYENKEWVWGYREDEPMGGHDPYSNSKGCSELVTSAYRRSFFQKLGVGLASARAGNVIGGGDWADNRLVPDILRACEIGQDVVIRNPCSTRPWQHVLEPLSGYLLLAQKLYEDGADYAEGWNFGPQEEDSRSVEWVVERLLKHWGGRSVWKQDGEVYPHESNYLKLDISKVRSRIGWHPKWDLDRALQAVVAWHKSWLRNLDMRDFCLQQIKAYES